MQFQTKLLLFFSSSGCTTIAGYPENGEEQQLYHRYKAASSSTSHATNNIHPIKGRWVENESLTHDRDLCPFYPYLHTR